MTTINSSTLEINLLAFGIARDVLGGSLIQLQLSQGATVGDLKAQLLADYPAFGNLASLAIAVNQEYAQDDLLLNSTDEIALIPPVSGG